MAFQAPQEIFYTSLFDVYTDIHTGNRRLAGIAHAFGQKESRALSVLPRIRWEPDEAEDRFLPAEMGGAVAIRPHVNGANTQVIIEEFDRRDAGCVVKFYAESYKALEDLVIRFRGALFDVLRADAVYSAKTGRASSPGSDGVNSWSYRMPLSVRLLCADTWAATSPLTSVGTIGSTVP